MTSILMRKNNVCVPICPSLCFISQTITWCWIEFCVEERAKNCGVNSILFISVQYDIHFTRSSNWILLISSRNGSSKAESVISWGTCVIQRYNSFVTYFAACIFNGMAEQQFVSTQCKTAMFISCVNRHNLWLWAEWFVSCWHNFAAGHLYLQLTGNTANDTRKIAKYAFGGGGE